MRNASTYRGARRNAARADRKQARSEKRPGELAVWRDTGVYANQANLDAKISERSSMVAAARNAAAAAMVKAGVLAQPSVAIAAMLEFYSNTKLPRTRVVNRIIRDLARQMPAVRAA